MKNWTCKTQPTKIVSFTSDDQIAIKAALKVIKEMENKGTPTVRIHNGELVINNDELHHCISVIMPEADAIDFEKVVYSEEFYQHVNNLVNTRNHILEVLNKLSVSRFGDPTWTDEFCYEDSDYTYHLWPEYKSDGTIDVNALKEQFNSKMHNHSEFEYDYYWNGIALKMYNLFNEEIFNKKEN